MAELSVVMLRWTKMLGSGEPPNELTWIMNKHRKVLGADPKALSTVFERDERSHVNATLTCKTPLRFLITHFIS